MKTVKAILSGIVQGVFFRRFVKENAEKLGIKGFVRNLEEGKLEIVAEGKDEDVNKLLKMCTEGPSNADVKDFKIEEMSHQGFDSFKRLSL